LMPSLKLKKNTTEKSDSKGEDKTLRSEGGEKIKTELM